ncbi:hypothetical protein [Kribbella speibonae]|uniref:Uncharacterized protein n=1 Tax=Kribbella speibonae TaxID=1572660 RepID=A0A4R0J320_9ACTN|nr:hypothetical protein [Kribbella speibonae]TCC40841.1 hypothetical protein E0H92_03920 [Kribbella speibonae]
MDAEPRHILYPPDWKQAGVVAHTDWATGCIRWFVSHDEWDAVHLQSQDGAVDLSPRQWFMLEAHAHELAHVLQITTTGFAYDLSCRLFSIVESAASKWADLERIYENRHEYADVLRSTLEVLDRPGPEGITPRAIVESLAFVQQKNFCYHDLTLDEMLQFLDTEVEDSDYRSAFDLAVTYLGANALRHFVHVANLSLYTTEPETVFVALLEEFAARASNLNSQSNHRIGTEFLGRHFPGMILGTAESQINAGLIHPALARNAADLANHSRLVIGDYARMYAADLNGETVDLLRTTMYFPATDEGRTPIRPSRSDVRFEDGDLSMSALRYYNAVSEILVWDLEPPESAPESAPSPTPGTQASEFGAAPELILVTLSRENLTSRTEQNVVCELFGELGSDPRLARAYRGMVTLQFGDPNWQPDLMDGDVQVCLRYFFDRFPHLLYFLLKNEEVADHPLSFVWAAYASDAQVRLSDGQGIGVRMNDGVLAVALRAVGAAADFAAQQGESRSTMLVHLEGLPLAIAGPIRSAVFGS